MIYHVFANKSNIGDWLSAKGIQSALRGYSVTELFCDAPYVEQTIAQLRLATPNDFVIIGGGGLFMDYFTPFWRSFYDLSRELSFGIWGVGYCDLTDEPSLPPNGLISDVIDRARFCHVRDQLTRTHLAGLALEPPTGCPSLLCFPETTPPGHGLLHADNYSTVGSDAFDFMDACGRRNAADRGRNYRRTNNRIEPGDAQLQQCLQLYRDADIILSSALHGCVIGIAMQRKVVAVSGDRKIDSFMESVGLGDWVCQNDDLGQLPVLLNRINEQQSCCDRVSALRTANEEVASKVRMLLNASHQVETL